MGSIRQQKMASLIQKELGTIFLKQFHELFERSLVTITIVRMSPDMAIAKIYLSVLGKERDKVIQNMIKSSSEIRFVLGKRLRNDLRIIPALQFYVDDSFDYAEKIEKLLK